MVITMLIALYTSRLVLANLGIEDYGLYNVVGGVVGLFAFLRTSMTSATQRFLSYELGNVNSCRLKNVFSTCLWSHILMAGIILILCETLGLWFLNAKLNIPEGRETAANWIYQFSIVTLCVNMLVVPYNACVISHEKMGIFAYISILVSILKLIIAIVISFSTIDKLVFYGALMLLVNVIEFIVYYIICRKKFHEAKWQFSFDKKKFAEIFGFSGWSLLGQLAIIGAGQGTSILVNMFYSVTANAAISIASQANNAISGLVSNFQTAYQPQITKSYASKDYEYLQRLIIQASKISFFLLFIVSLPIIFNIDFLLNLWLESVPRYTSDFIILFLISSMLNAVGGPLWMSIYATGRIKNYQITVALVYFFEIALVYFLFSIGLSPIYSIVAKIIANAIVVSIRMIFTSKQVECFSYFEYIKLVIIPIVSSVTISTSITYLLLNFATSLYARISATIVSIIGSSLIVFYVALSKHERNSLLRLFKYKIK